jgi:excisionase family DNA binding protein
MAKDAKSTSVERDVLVDINVVAARLGVQVRFIRRLVHERRIPYVKWGHLLRFDPAEIEGWLDRARTGEHTRSGRSATDSHARARRDSEARAVVERSNLGSASPARLAVPPWRRAIARRG